MSLDTWLLFKQRPYPRIQWGDFDRLLLLLLLLLCVMGLLVLYSASNQSFSTIEQQCLHYLIGFATMTLCLSISPLTWQRLAPWLYGMSTTLLIMVLIIGHIGKGAQRWLTIGIMHYQPAELMKIALPLMIAWRYRDSSLPVSLTSIGSTLCLIILPAIFIAKQPDLGTAILLMAASLSLLLLIGPSKTLCCLLMMSLLICLPIGWHHLHDYQRQRILTFLNPERDPLGTGYHIIQSKIAFGSGGLFGKGWLNGTQSHLHFLPEHTTDFIFALIGEEFGLIGSIGLIILYWLIVIRGLLTTLYAQTTFTRLLAGGITLMFFASCFVNMGMVTGLLPVVGVPLPLISYGGSSIMTTMVNFGILFSIQTHRILAL